MVVAGARGAAQTNGEVNKHPADQKDQTRRKSHVVVFDAWKTRCQIMSRFPRFTGVNLQRY